MSKPCPECGKLLNATSGVFPRSCPFCSTSLIGLVDDSGLGMSAPSVPIPPPNAPSAPKAPAPSKPRIPKV